MRRTDALSLARTLMAAGARVQDRPATVASPAAVETERVRVCVKDMDTAERMMHGGTLRLVDWTIWTDDTTPRTDAPILFRPFMGRSATFYTGHAARFIAR